MTREIIETVNNIDYAIIELPVGQTDQLRAPLFEEYPNHDLFVCENFLMCRKTERFYAEPNGRIRALVIKHIGKYYEDK